MCLEKKSATRSHFTFFKKFNLPLVMYFIVLTTVLLSFLCIPDLLRAKHLTFGLLYHRRCSSDLPQRNTSGSATRTTSYTQKSRLGMSVTKQEVLDDSTLQVLDGKLINLFFNLELSSRCVLF